MAVQGDISDELGKLAIFASEAPSRIENSRGHQRVLVDAQIRK